jgi:hypothetical protein
MFFTISYGIGLGCDSPVRRESFRSGSAWLGRFQKDGLPSRCRGWHGKLGFKAINSRTGKGSLIAAPFNRDPGLWTPTPHTSLFCSRSCRSSAQPSPGLWITLFSARSLPRLLRSPLSAQPHDPGGEAGGRAPEILSTGAQDTIGTRRQR